MKIHREILSEELQIRANAEAPVVRQACIGCPGCEGPCVAMVEAMTVPDIVLGKPKN